MEKQKTRISSSFYTRLYLILGVALIILSLYSTIQVSYFGSAINQKIAEAKESARPAELKMVTIVNKGCNDCFDITPVVESIKKANVKITEEENLDLNSEKAKELVSKYKIAKIPTVLLSGEIGRASLNFLEKKDDALVFTKTTTPYTDAQTHSIIGRVSVTILKDSSCEKCTDPIKILDIFKKSEIKISSEKTVERSSDEGKELIKKYSLKALPTLIFSKDLEAYSSELVKNWNMYGSIEEDGSHIIREIIPPYLNITEDKIEGLVTITHILDSSCTNCYSTKEFQMPVLEKMGLVFEKEEKVNISSAEGKALIGKYNITKVPTIILQGGMDKYSILKSVWKDVGTVESDGTYVFREVEVSKKPYKDLTTGEIITPVSQPTA